MCLNRSGSIRSITLIGVAITVAINACSEYVPDDPIEYAAFLRDRELGLRSTRTVNGLSLEMKYDPPALIAMRSNDEEGSEELYKDATTFVLSIISHDSEGSIVVAGADSYSEYADRIALLNFSMGDYFSLEVGDSVTKPVIASFENSFGLSPVFRVMLVFEGNPEQLLSAAETFDIIFLDPVFETGVNRFTFRTLDILNVPTPRS